MRLMEFSVSDGSPRIGAVVGDGAGAGVCDLTARLGDTSLHQLLQRPDWRSRVAVDIDADIALAEVTFGALLGATGRVFAAGLNYEKIYPAGEQPPKAKYPPWFNKMPGTLVAHEEPILAPVASASFDYEAELAAVLGATGRHIPVDRALSLVAGWTCLNDGSVREWQRHSVNAGKNFERSGSIGPWMVTADEIADPQNLRLTARVDGELRQNASTSEMIFTVAGQTVEVEVEGIGILRNPVIAEPRA